MKKRMILVMACFLALGWISTALAADSVPVLKINGPMTVVGGTSPVYEVQAQVDEGVIKMNPAMVTWTVVSGNEFAQIKPDGKLETQAVTADSFVGIKADVTWENQVYPITGLVTLIPRSTKQISRVSSTTTTPVLLAAAPLSRVEIVGASTVRELETSQYTLTAFYADGTTQTVKGTWTIPTIYASYASIASTTGILSAKLVSANKAITVNAKYIEGGVTKTATKTVTITDYVFVPVTLYFAPYSPSTVWTYTNYNYLYIVAVDAAGVARMVSSTTTWISSKPTVLSFPYPMGSTNHGACKTFSTMGSVLVTAKYGGLQASMYINVIRNPNF